MLGIRSDALRSMDRGMYIEENVLGKKVRCCALLTIPGKGVEMSTEMVGGLPIGAYWFRTLT